LADSVPADFIGLLAGNMRSSVGNKDAAGLPSMMILIFPGAGGREAGKIFAIINAFYII
jgi:hypothetical protein